MAEGSLPETSDTAIRAFIDLFALGFVLAGIDMLSRGEGWGKVGGYWVIAAALSAGSFWWERLKTRIGGRLVTSLNAAATDARWWIVAMLVFFIYLGLAPLVQRIKRASDTAEAVPEAVPIPSSVQRAGATPIGSPTPIPSTLIKPQDQGDLADAMAKQMQSFTNLHCKALILRCPSVDCEDDGRALMRVLVQAGWTIPWEPTSHGWERLKPRLVIHSKRDDTCAALFGNTLDNFGIDKTWLRDPTMRKSDHVEIVIRSGK